MKILIAGRPNSGQLDVIQRLLGREIDHDGSLCGFVMDHKFVTKYFNVDCGIWADEFEDTREWSKEFSSEEAEEVRDAVKLFIYTFDSNKSDHAGLDQFVASLDRPGICIAVPKDGMELSKANTEDLIESGFDLASIDELLPIVHSTLYDAMADDDSGGELDDHEDEEETTTSKEAPRELDEIMDELKDALHSKTMTKDDKRALAERLADELVL